MALDLNRFNACLHALYGAALEPAGWSTALAAIADLLQARAADLVLVHADAPDGVSVLAHRLPDDAEHRRHFAELAPVNPRMAYTLAHPEQDVLHDALFIDAEGMRQSAFYDWLESSAGVRYYLGTSAFAAHGPGVGLSAHWSPTDGAPNEHWRREAMLLLRPHLERAVQLSAALAASRTQVAIQQQALQHAEHAVFVLDGSGALLFQNAAGEAVLARGNFLRQCGHYLEAVHPSEQSTFKAMVEGAARSLNGGPLAASRPYGIKGAQPGRTISLTVMPFPAGREMFAGARPAVLVMLPNTSQQSDQALVAYADRFRLTPREAEIAALLLAGRSPKQIAQVMAISINTIRTHVARLYEKAGVRRQADLVRRLLGAD